MKTRSPGARSERANASYVVGKKPELGFGYLKVGAEGHTTITTRSRTRAAGESTVEVYADMQINNTGTESAEGLKSRSSIRRLRRMTVLRRRSGIRSIQREKH